MATIDDLSVRVSASTGSFERGMEGAQDGLNSVRNASGTTSASLQVLQGRIDEVEDELSSVNREATQTTGSFAALSAGSSGLNASFMGLSATTIGTLVPSLVTLSTVIAPLAVVLGGIAAAAASLGAVFGGLALVGVITHMSELQTALKQAREEIMLIIEPLGDVFGPLLVDAVEALPELVQAIVDSLGPMDEFRNTLIAFGDAAMELIPQIAGGMFNLAEAALPALNNALEWFVNSGGDAFATMANVFERVYPLVAELGVAFADLAPTILEFGTHVSQLVVPALSDMVDSMNSVMAAVNSLEPDMQNLVTSAVILAPVLSVVATVLTSLSAPVIALIGAVGALAAAFQTDFMGIRTQVEEIVPTFSEMQAMGEEALTVLTEGVEEVAEFMEPLTEEVILLGEEMAETVDVVLNSLEPTFNSLQSILQDNEAEIQNFATAVRGAMTGFVNFLRTFVQPAFQFVFGQVIAPIVNRVAAQVADNFGPVLSEVTDTIRVLGQRANTTGNILRDVWNSIDHIVVPVIDYLVQQIGTFLVGAIDGATQAFMFLLNIIQGDFDGAITNLQDGVDTVIGTVTSLGSEVQEGLQSAVDPVTSAAGDIYDSIINSFSDLPGAMADLFVDAFSGLQSAVNSAIGLPWEISIPSVTIAGEEIGGGSITVPAFGGSGGGSSGQSGGGGDNTLPYYQDMAQQQQSDTSTSESTRNTTVELTVDGDTEVIRDISYEVVDEQDRRQRRNSGRTTNL